MNIRAYSDMVAENFYIDPAYDKQSHAALGIAGEAGEIADMIKKSQYSRKRKPLDLEELKLELGDVLWYVTALAGLHGWDLMDLMESNVAKLADRHPNGTYSTGRLWGNTLD